ncbi:MAG: extracellular solute-binding protein [Dehalococcoidia bacterium]|nr:extracellular solute-binding protein [Dehalococcoidia bacterium]
MQESSASPARRAFLRVAGLSGAAAIAAACAPAAAPAPAAGAPAGGAAPAGKAAWEKEWDDLVAAAKKEGKLTAILVTGTGWRKMLDKFGDTFGITVEAGGGTSASIWVPKVQKEREAKIYSYDVAVTPPNSAITLLRPEGAWDPVRPLMFRPDILDSKVWRDGFEGRWMDKDKQVCFNWEFAVTRSFSINTDLVKPDELKSVNDVLNPKWKGKIIAADARIGGTFLAMAALRSVYGDEWVKKFLTEMDVTFTRDQRAVTEGLVRGRYAIALYNVKTVFQEFADQGLGKNIQYLDYPQADYAPAYSVFAFNRAPNPNAAKLFINWLLTKDTQEYVCSVVPTNSARLDVTNYDKDGAAAPGQNYYVTGREENYAKVADTQQYISRLLGVN